MRMLLTTMTVLVLFAGSTHAAVLVEETFNYAVSDDTPLQGLNGGTGWAGAWGAPAANTGAFVIEGGDAIYKGSSGGNPAQPRDFANAITITEGVTISIEFSLILNETQAGRSMGLDIMNDGNVLFFVGKGVNNPTGLFEAHNGGNLIDGDDDRFTPNQSRILRLDMTYDGTDTKLLLTNVGASETLDPAFISGQVTFDGIRLAGHHQDTVSNGIGYITIIPEPASMALVGLGSVLLLARRHRRG